MAIVSMYGGVRAHWLPVPGEDHIIPLAKGGKHERTNVRCLCRGCNMSKGSRVKNEQLLIIG